MSNPIFDLARLISRASFAQPLMHSFYQRFVQPDKFRQPHPFDREYKVDTSGFIPSTLLQAGLRSTTIGHPYTGCIPNCVRAGLNSISNLETYAFVDLGCGKGRALVVATEYKFRLIYGVELSAALASVARRNSESIRQQFPERTQISVDTADATFAKYPDGSKVVYMYHSLPFDILQTVTNRLISESIGSKSDLYLFYENPVFFELLDNHPNLERHYAASIECDPEELGLNLDDSNAVCIWTLRRTARRGGTRIKYPPLIGLHLDTGIRGFARLDRD